MNTRAPYFSVIIPAFNADSSLDAALSSARKQTFPDLEIIVVDDASTDRTKEIIENAQNEDERIKAIFFDENCGTHIARKKGILQASGQYILFLDSDDTFKPHTCAALYEYLVVEPYDILHFGEQIINAGDPKHQAVVDLYRDLFVPYDGDIEGTSLVNACFVDKKINWALHGKVYDTKLLKKAVGYTNDNRIILSEDTYLMFIFLHFARKYKGLPDRVLYNYYYGKGISSIVQQDLSSFYQILAQLPEVADSIHLFMQELGVIDRYQEAYAKIRADYVFQSTSQWLALNDDDREKTADALGSTCTLPELLQAFSVYYMWFKVTESRLAEAQGKINSGDGNIESMKKRIETLEARQCELESGMEWYANSTSYKLGMALTAAPRWLKRKVTKQ